MDMLIEPLGWLGAVTVLTAYAMLARGKMSSDSYTYHNANILGGLFLAVYATAKGAFASTFINIAWMVIGVIALVRLHKSKKGGNA